MDERFITLWNSNETRLRALTTETYALRNGRPFDPVEYSRLISVLNTYPFASINLSVSQFAQLIGGPLQMGKRTQLQSKIVERTNPDLAMSIVNRTKVMLLATEAVLRGASIVRGAVASVGLGLVGADDAGSAGLGLVGADDAVLSTGAVIGLAIVVGVSTLLLATLAASVMLVAQVSTTAAVYCIAAGCTATEVVAITQALTNSAVEIIGTNPINRATDNLTKDGGAFGDLIFWGGLLAVGSGIAYMIWKAQGEPIPGKIQRALAGLGEDSYDPDRSNIKKLVAKGVREEDYIDTSQWDNLFENPKPASPQVRNALVAMEPLMFAKNAPARNAPVPTRAANAPARNAPVPTRAANPSRQGTRLVATLPAGENVNQSKYRAWEIACRAQGVKKNACSPLEEEEIQQIQTRLILPVLSATEMDRVAKALRGGGYSVKVEK